MISRRDLALAALLLVAGLLRFDGLSERGLLGIDEGFYADVVRSYGAISSFATGKIRGTVDGGLAPYFEEHGGNIFLGEKPTFAFLGFLTSTIVGVHDYTLLYLSALAGTVIVLLTFWLGRQLFDGAGPALAAAFLVAISPLHLAFSRSAYPNITASAVAWCAVCAYVKHLERGPHSERWLLASGALVGIAFTVHTGFFWLPAILIASELLRAFKADASGRRALVGTFARLALVMATPLVAWDLLFRSARWVLELNPAWSNALQRSSGQAAFLTYFESLWLWVRPADGLVLSDAFLHPSYYVELLARHDAWPVLAAAVAGVATLPILRGTKHLGPWLWVASFLILPVSVYSLMAFGGARHMVVVVPAMCLLACRAVDGLAGFVLPTKYHRFRAVALVTLVVAVAGLEAPCIRQVLTIRSGYRDMVDYMAAHDGTKHLSDRMYVGRLYVGRANVLDHFYSLRASDADAGRHHISLARLKTLRDEGFRYFLRNTRQPAVVPPYDNELVVATDAGGRSLFETTQPVGWYWPAEICRCEEDADIPQKLQLFVVDDVIRYLERENRPLSPS